MPAEHRPKRCSQGVDVNRSLSLVSLRNSGSFHVAISTSHQTGAAREALEAGASERRVEIARAGRGQIPIVGVELFVSPEAGRVIKRILAAIERMTGWPVSNATLDLPASGACNLDFGRAPPSSRGSGQSESALGEQRHIGTRPGMISTPRPESNLSRMAVGGSTLALVARTPAG